MLFWRFFVCLFVVLFITKTQISASTPAFTSVQFTQLFWKISVNNWHCFLFFVQFFVQYFVSTVIMT